VITRTPGEKQNDMHLKQSSGGARLKQCDVLHDLHVPGKATREYGAEKSGTILYEFNSNGYRGEELNPSAKFRICVVGESNAFGTGLSIEETFGYKLKQHFATSLQLGLNEVNLINLSVGGASADYCVRTLYRQLPLCDVDFVVCQMPEPTRIEHIDRGEYYFYNVKGRLKDLEGAPASLLGFCEYYSPEVGMMNQMKNSLLIQAFLKERRIDYVIATQYLRNHFYLEDYFDRLDASAVLWHDYFIRKADLARDMLHAGRRSHAAFAVDILSLFGRMQSERGNKDRGRRIESYASHLRATDEDWKFCRAFIARQMAGEKGRNSLSASSSV
jgi:hypothetical protein